MACIAMKIDNNMLNLWHCLLLRKYPFRRSSYRIVAANNHCMNS